MKTLGDYSKLCRRLDDALKQSVNGIEKLSLLCDTAFIYGYLADDGIVDVAYNEINLSKGKRPVKGYEISSVSITPKGRELLNRGGYSSFMPKTDFLDYCGGIVVFRIAPDKLFIPDIDKNFCEFDFGDNYGYLYDCMKGWHMSTEDFEYFKPYLNNQEIPYVEIDMANV